MKPLWIPLALSVLVAAAWNPPASGDSRGHGQDCDRPSAVILQAGFSGWHDAGVWVLETQGEWCAFWDEVHSHLFPPPPCDPTLVDFDREVVLVAALGARPDTCYAVGIPCVQALGTSDNVRAHVVEYVPGPGCNCMDAITHPVVAVRIDRPVHRVQVRTETAVVPCP